MVEVTFPEFGAGMYVEDSNTVAILSEFKKTFLRKFHLDNIATLNPCIKSGDFILKDVRKFANKNTFMSTAARTICSDCITIHNRDFSSFSVKNMIHLLLVAIVLQVYFKSTVSNPNYFKIAYLNNPIDMLSTTRC